MISYISRPGCYFFFLLNPNAFISLKYQRDLQPSQDSTFYTGFGSILVPSATEPTTWTLSLHVYTMGMLDSSWALPVCERPVCKPSVLSTVIDCFNFPPLVPLPMPFIHSVIGEVCIYPLLSTHKVLREMGKRMGRGRGRHKLGLSIPHPEA